MFEVLIDILTKDESLRPSMTTSNKILIETYNDVVSVPLEAINAEKEISYVWVKSGGLQKKEVKIAAVNDISALIYNGLGEKEEVFLSFPGDTAGEALMRADSTAVVPKPFVDEVLRKKLDDYLAAQKASKRNENAGMFNMIIEDEE
ncbi:MAG: hypothetical protein R2850_03155 [Bacteroidia bacterium]